MPASIPAYSVSKCRDARCDEPVTGHCFSIKGRSLLLVKRLKGGDSFKAFLSGFLSFHSKCRTFSANVISHFIRWLAPRRNRCASVPAFKPRLPRVPMISRQIYCLLSYYRLD